MGKLSEIAQRLVSRYHVTQGEAEDFLSNFITLIGDALREERIVKIKGLGTFRLTKVNSRESVDVNTGERIVIDGRDKISFTPDTTMRDLVNGPFAQFTTVVVNDGVDFSDIDEKYKVSPETAEVEEEELSVEAQPHTFEQSDKPSETLEEPKETQEQSEIAHEEPQDETIDAQHVAIQDDSSHEDAVGELGFGAVEIAPSESDGRSDEVQQTDAVEPDDCSDEVQERGCGGSTALKILIAAVVAMMLLCVAGAIYFFHELSLRDNRIAHLEAQAQRSIGTSAAAVTQGGDASESVALSPDSITSIQQRQEAKNEKNVATQKEAALKPSVSNEPATIVDKPVKVSAPAANVAAAAQDAYNNDARVRTGAYIIIGVDKTVTVGKGQTLASISKAYLGQGMECYVEALNGTTECEPGDKLKIPKLQLKKKKKK